MAGLGLEAGEGISACDDPQGFTLRNACKTPANPTDCKQKFFVYFHLSAFRRGAVKRKCGDVDERSLPDPANGKGNYLAPEGFSARTESDSMRLRYFKAPAGKLNAHGKQPHKWLENITLPEEIPYPSDQMVVFDSPDQKFDVVLRAGELPIIVVNPDGNEIFITNRFFHQGCNMESDWLEKIQYALLRNLFTDLNVEVRVSGESKSRVRYAPWYGSYGLSGHLAWNFMDDEIQLDLGCGKQLTIPSRGWAVVK